MNVGLLASQAAVALLQAAGLTTVTNFYAEAENPDAEENLPNTRAVPCVLCFFSDAQEFPMFTGNYSGSLTFQLITSADDTTAEQFAAMFDEVWSAISTDTFVEDLSDAGTGFTCFGMTNGFQQSAQVKIPTESGRPLRAKSIIAPINCCASDIS